MKKPKYNLETVRRELERSSRLLFEEGGNPRLLGVLRARFPGISRAYVVDWVPEQGEDIYTILVSPHVVAIIEITKHTESPAPVIRTCTIMAYQEEHPSLSREQRDKFTAALELMLN